MFYLIKGLEAGSWRWKGWGLGWVSSPGDPKYLAVEPVNQIFSPFGVRTKMLILTKWYPGNKVWGLIAPISMTCSPVLARSPGAQIFFGTLLRNLYHTRRIFPVLFMRIWCKSHLSSYWNMLYHRILHIYSCPALLSGTDRICPSPVLIPPRYHSPALTPRIWQRRGRKPSESPWSYRSAGDILMLGYSSSPTLAL